MQSGTIVRSFDLFESHVSNAYARGRTRGRESHIVFMIERGNDVHRRILSQVTQLDTSMRRWTESVSKGLGGAIPPRTLRESTDPYYSESDDDEENFILDPTTSGRIRLQDATTVIYRFAARLGVPQDSTDISLFEFKELDVGLGVPRAYECTVVLPLSPLKRITGSPCALQSLARRSASYQACLELFNVGLLDYTLFPLPPKVIRSATSILERGGPAEPENKSAGVRCYPKKRPNFWPNTVSISLGGFLYPTIICTDHSSEPLHSFGPMVILTRRPFPHFPSFSLFFSGVPAVIHLIQAAPISIVDERLRDIHMYTIRVCRAISNRPFMCPLENMPYFFAPLRGSWSKPISSGRALQNINDHISWDLLSMAAKTWVIALQTESVEKLEQDIEDAVIQDRWVEFTRRYQAVKIRRDLSPLSKPADSPVRLL
jgi:endoribonuclease Dicer